MKRILSILLAILMLMHTAWAETVVGDVDARLNAGQIEVNGEKYRPKKRLSTLLLIGTDQEEDEKAGDALRSGKLADFLVLLVVDENAETITPIQIHRNTMAPINLPDPFGQDEGPQTAQICLSYSFGDGKEQSCGLTVDAVSRYLGDIPIDNFAAMDLSGITAFNDALGGVEVTLEDDFSAYDETMIPGATLVLQGMQAEYYVRMRYSAGGPSDLSRLKRQWTYIERAKESLKEKIYTGSNSFDSLFSALGSYILTDMNAGRLINFARLLSRCEFLPVMEIEGESIEGADGLMEFHPDEDSLQQTILTAFYEKIGS